MIFGVVVDEHLEHTTPKGFLIRVNLKHGTFLLFENGIPIAMARSGMIQQIHPLNQIIFLGEAFDFSRYSVNTIGFYPVDRTFMKIPFHYSGSNIVRYIRIPVLFDNVDELPAIVLYSKSYWPGPLPAINQGQRYFVADPQIPRMGIVKLKTKYPRSRVIIYKPDEMLAVKLQEKESNTQKKRAVDLIDTEESLLLAQNPVFAARVYLRRLDWKKMFSLPLYGVIQEEDTQNILSFLNNMLNNLNQKTDLIPHQDVLLDLQDFYTGLSLLFKQDMPQILQWKKNLRKKRQLLQYFLPAIEAQIHFQTKENKTKFAQFLADAGKLLKESLENPTDENI